MFPWNYGFHWTTGTVVFLGAFYLVLAVVAATVIAAVRRSQLALNENRADDIRWHSEFHDLPVSDQDCRYVIAGALRERACPNAFDCRECKTHNSMVANRPPARLQAPDAEILGMPFPLDRFYHRGHTWVRPEPDGSLTVGMDELGKRIFGRPEGLELPAPGAQLRVNGPAWHVQKRGADIRVLSPVDGEVVETGGPDKDWYLKVRPADGIIDMRHLLSGTEVRPWLMREMERLQMALSVDNAAAPSLADGGVPVDDISAGYPKTDWEAVCSRMFMEP